LWRRRGSLSILGMPPGMSKRVAKKFINSEGVGVARWHLV
jgi:hypothetical protein